MKKNYSFKVPEATKMKFENLVQLHVKALATKSGNEKAYKAINDGSGYDHVVDILGVNTEYSEYLELVEESINKSNMIPEELNQDFHIFLLAKICFPDEV